MTPTKPKEKLYKTAYSHDFKCYLAITDAKRVCDKWMFRCTNIEHGVNNRYIPKNELVNFCL